MAGVLKIQSDTLVGRCIGQNDIDDGTVAGFFNGFDVKPQKRFTGSNGLIFADQGFKSLAFHVDGIDADVDENFFSIAAFQPDGMSGWGNHHDGSIEGSDDFTLFRHNAEGFSISPLLKVGSGISFLSMHFP